MNLPATLFVVFVSVGAAILWQHAPTTARASNAAVPVSQKDADAGAADGQKVIEDSMHEFMEYVFQPTYRRLKVSMAEEPTDNAGWKAIKSDALILAESCNLLFLRQPEEDAADWTRHAAASRDTGAALYQAARGKKFKAAREAWTSMLTSCNACHRQFEDGRHILTP
ncbi:MAG: hypothetical protein RIK87_14210 [Fuerstiella sp.]